MKRDPEELVFAICHEVGNLLAAVRLQAHLLEDGLTPKEMARASIDLDDASARASALLNLVRPLLRPEPDRWVPTPPAAVVAAVSATLEGEGLRGVDVTAAVDDEMPSVDVEAETMQALLLCQLYGALEAAAPWRAAVALRVVRDGPHVVFRIDNGGAESDDLDEGLDAAARGRPLACVVAGHVLAARGGSLVVDRPEARNGGTLRRVELRLPASG